MRPNPLLLPADVGLTRSSSFIGDTIRVFETSPGEKATKVNHSFIVTDMGRLCPYLCQRPLPLAQIVEARSRVRHHELYKHYHADGRKVSIWRNPYLFDRTREIIATHAFHYVGKKYGTQEIVGHALDRLCGGIYFFRKIFGSDNYPICSWVTAYAYKKAGIACSYLPADATDPDDIWDFVKAEGWECILSLQEI